MYISVNLLKNFKKLFGPLQCHYSGMVTYRRLDKKLKILPLNYFILISQFWNRYKNLNNIAKQVFILC